MGNKPVKQHLENAQKTGVLQLENFELKELPAKILEARQQLRTLNLAGNHFEHLPTFLGEFAALKFLNLDRNRLTYLPDEIGRLKKLETLNVSYNQLTILPASIGQLTNLKTITLTHNRLIEFPLVLCQLTNVDVLDLSSNKIKSIPDREEIERLTALELIMNQNQLNSLPSRLAACRRLKVLRVEENCLPLDAFKTDEQRLLTNSNISLLAVNGNLFDVKDFRQLSGYEKYMERFTETKKKMG